MTAKPERVRCPRMKRAITVALRLVGEGWQTDDAAKHGAMIEAVDGPAVHFHLLRSLEADSSGGITVAQTRGETSGGES